MIIAYTRVSVEDTTDTNSLSLQESRIRAQAEIHGRNISDVFTDNGVSSAHKARQRSMRSAHSYGSGRCRRCTSRPWTASRASSRTSCSS